MDCSKSWELMMEKTDGRIRESDSDKLKRHIIACRGCKEQWGLLQTAFDELESLQVRAPHSIEKSVMSRICSARRKESMGMLPYVVSPIALILALLVIFAFNAFKGGPIPVADETTHALSFLVKAVQTVGTAAEYVFKVFRLQEALIVLPAILLIWILSVLYRIIGKMSDGQTYRRASE